MRACVRMCVCVEIVVWNGRAITAVFTRCRTRYACSIVLFIVIVLMCSKDHLHQAVRGWSLVTRGKRDTAAADGDGGSRR